MKREPEPVYPVRRMVYPFLHAGPYTVEGLAYIDGIWLNPNNVTFIADAYEKRGQGDSTIQRIHFIGGEHVDVDGERDRVVWRIDSALALLQKEKREGKRELSPTPPIEKREEEKAPPPPPARGRARVSEAILKKWKIEPLFVQYWSEEIDNDSIKDPNKHIKNCWTHRGSDKSWQEYKRLHPVVTPPKEEKHYNLLGEVK